MLTQTTDRIRDDNEEHLKNLNLCKKCTEPKADVCRLYRPYPEHCEVFKNRINQQLK
jgi:hypothetical protein